MSTTIPAKRMQLSEVVPKQYAAVSGCRARSSSVAGCAR